MSKYTILIILILTAFGCTEDRFSNVVEVEIPEHQPAIVIGAEWTIQDSVLQVLVSKSSPIIGDVEVESLKNATVEVTKNGSPFGNFAYNPESNFYEFRLDTPLQDDGATYRIVAKEPNYQDASTEQTMPRTGLIENLEYKPDAAISSDGYKSDEVTFDIVDAAGEDFYTMELAYYFAQDSGNGEIWEGTDELYAETVDTQLESADYGRIHLLKDVSFDGGRYRVRLTTSIWNQGNEQIEQKLIVRLGTISKENYYYQRSLQLYMNAQDNPFAEPVVVFDNIEDGHGIFRMANLQTFEIDL